MIEDHHTNAFILIEELCYKWPNGSAQTKIGPVNFEAHLGEIIGIYGRSGTGKSTLLRMIVGELKPTSGRMDIPNNYKVLYHDQNQKLVPWLNASQNVMINSKKNVSDEYVEKIFELCGLNLFADRSATALSGGQRARVSIARTLIENGEVVLLDEPFSGIDIKSQEMLIDEMKRTVSDKILVLTSHDPGILVQLCTQIVCFTDPSSLSVASNSDEAASTKIFQIDEKMINLSPKERKSYSLYMSEIQRLSGFIYE